MKNFTLLFTLMLFSPVVFAQTPTQRVAAAEKNVEGKTFKGIGVMTVKRDSEIRTMKMKFWWKDRRLALIRVLEPKKDSGTGNLRIGTDLWQYLPKVNRIIRVPSSMMLQSWMGSDFSNDDLVKGGSLLTDYTHKALGNEKIGTHNAVKIECTPKPTAPVVWGKVILWVRASDNAPIKHEYYTEKGDLVKVMEGEKFENFGNHHMPTRLTMKNLKKQNSETNIEYEKSSIEFDTDIPDNLFTQENLRRGLN